MKKITLFLLSLIFVQTTLAAGFKVEIVDREPTDEDKNTFAVSINNKTSLGLKEMEAFKSCVLDITIVNPLVYGQSKEQKTKNIKDLLKLTETSSVEDLNSVLKDLTCKLYKAQSSDNADEKDKIVILTTPTPAGLDALIEGPLTDCLGNDLDDSLKISVKTRKSGLTLPEETKKKQEEERYCP